MSEPWESVYSSPDTSVCPDCISDPFLRGTVEDSLEEDRQCSYCGASPAATIDVVLDMITETIGADYTDPANVLPYESAEGGYQGYVQDGMELVYELSPWTDNEELLEDAASAFAGTAWCEANYFSLGAFDVLRYGWEGFVEQVKHQTRYLFLEELGSNDPYEREEVPPPGRMLSALAKLIREHCNFRILDASSPIFRVRVHSDVDRLDTVQELGSPPLEYARHSNRMSPAGISMFYGALDMETAIIETFDPTQASGKAITLGIFKGVKPLLLLDFTDLPSVPGDFDENNRHLRAPIAFLHAFVTDLTKPVSRDGYEHVDYVPTQVVTEFVRHRLRGPEDQSINGIAYQSSRDGGRIAVVIFADAEACGPRDDIPIWGTEPILKLVEIRRVSPANFAHLW